MENTLRSFDVKIIATETPKYFFDVSNMIELAFGIDEDVIKVYYQEFVN